MGCMGEESLWSKLAIFFWHFLCLFEFLHYLIMAPSTCQDKNKMGSVVFVGCIVQVLYRLKVFFSQLEIQNDHKRWSKKHTWDNNLQFVIELSTRISISADLPLYLLYSSSWWYIHLLMSCVLYCFPLQLPILASSVVSLYFLELTDIFQPVHSGYSCNDRSLSLPYILPKQEVCTLPLLFSLAFAAPTVTVSKQSRASIHTHSLFAHYIVLI